MAFPISPTNGQTTTINGVTYTYDSSTASWTRIQRSFPSLSINVDTFISDGVTVSYVLGATPSSKEVISVNIDGVLQQKSAYNILANVLTLTGTPITGAIIEVKTIIASTATVITGLVYDTFTGDGTTTAYSLSTSPTTKYFTLVTVGGVVQNKANYSVTNNVLTFSTAPPITAPIEIVTFGPAVSSATTMAAGSDNQIQFNTGSVLNSSSNLTYNPTTNTFATGNITLGTATATGNITAPYFIGNGSQLTSVPTAGTVTTNAQPNITSLGTLTSLTVSGISTFQVSTDILTNKTGATGIVAHDLSAGGVFYHTTPSANFTANFTNVATTDARVTMASLIVTQGATPYAPTAVQIDGVAQSIKWLSSITPTGTASKIDIFSFSLLRNSNSWVIIGQSGTYG